jgi:7-cyano-7-deazaguanine synthase
LNDDKKPKRTVLIFSGGLDSSTLLYFTLLNGYNVHALSFNYGQRHVRELSCAKDVAFRAQQFAKPLDLEVTHSIIDLCAFRSIFTGSSQTDSRVDVPKGHYEDESMKLTVVPNRNMIMLSIAAAFAISSKTNSITYGAHAGDHAIYPDCRPSFIDAMRQVLMQCDYTSVQLKVPFMNFSKADIVRMGLKWNVPFERTWTCYEGEALPCRACGACVERAEAFKMNKADDPLLEDPS